MYKLTQTDSIIRLADYAWIPADVQNKDYAEYLAWLDAGNIPEHYDIAPVIIPSVTPWQIRKALNALNLRDQVEVAVLQADQNTKDAWQYATQFVRTDPLVIALGAALGQTEQMLDDLFIFAASL